MYYVGILPQTDEDDNNVGQILSGNITDRYGAVHNTANLKNEYDEDNYDFYMLPSSASSSWSNESITSNTNTAEFNDQLTTNNKNDNRNHSHHPVQFVNLSHEPPRKKRRLLNNSDDDNYDDEEVAISFSIH